jgi:TolB protein
MDADGRRERALPTATTLGRTVSWSPDGTRIVASYRGSVYVVEIASGRRTQLTRSTLDLAPAWSPDGRRIVFSGYRDERYFRDPEAWGLFEIAANGSGVRKLLTGYHHNAAWSPDATRLVFQSYGVLWRANADGTGLARVLGDNTSPEEGWNERPSWGP